MSDAGRRRFDVILTESLDRLSRDLEDVANIFKRMRFAGIKVWTVGEGEIRDELLVGLRGAMSALYLQDLACKDAARVARPRRGR